MSKVSLFKRKPETLETVRSYVKSGLSVIPIRTDGTKSPAVKVWKPFQSKLPSDSVLEGWYPPGSEVGVGILGGAVSQNLEVLDFDAPELFDPWCQLVREESGGHLLDKFYIYATPAGGRHVHYRCETPVEGNQKLAQRKLSDKETKTLIETRGEGGYVVAPPSPPTCHPLKKPYEILQGSAVTLPVITKEERNLLLSCARAFNEYVKTIAAPPIGNIDGSSTRPGDDFNRRATWDELLLPHGVQKIRTINGVTHWRRPGKNDGGISATTGHDGHDVLYVFSSNFAPFESGTGYRKFTAHTLLNFSGDFKNAAASLCNSHTTESQPEQKQEWRKPLKIKAQLPPVPAFDPAEMLPAAVVPFVKDLATRTSTPPIFSAASLLVAVASVVGAAVRMQPRQNDTGWQIVPVLWGVLIGKPGNNKSAPYKRVMRFLERLEKEAAASHKKESAAFEMSQKVQKARMAAADENLNKAARKLKGSLSIDEATQELEKLQQELESSEPPTARCYVTSDATIEALQKLCSENHRGVMVAREELKGLFLAWTKPGREGERQFFLEAHGGGAFYRSDRIGRGTTISTSTTISIFGTTQPDVIRKWIIEAQNGTGDDGLIQRFALAVCPDEPPYVEIDENEDAEAAATIANMIGFLTETQFEWARQRSGEPPHFRFAEDVQPLFSEWNQRLRGERTPACDNSLMKEHLAKFSGLLPTIALVLHLIDAVTASGGPGENAGFVTRHSFDMAVRWCEHLEKHAERIYSLPTGAGGAKLLAQRITEARLHDSFTASQVARKGWESLTDTASVEEACAALVDAHWLRAERTKSGPQGGATTVRYYINPECAKSADTRQGDQND